MSDPNDREQVGAATPPEGVHLAPREGDPWWLVPPKTVAFSSSGHWTVRAGKMLVATPAAPIEAALRRFAAAVEQATGARMTVRAHAGGHQPLLMVRLIPEATHIPDQGYHLEVGPSGGVLEASSRSGILYGLETLRDLIERYGPRVPAVRIDDAPSLAVRGVMLDISRTKVPTMETLYQLVDRLAQMRINHLELYMEHTFAYRDHPEVWTGASPMTGEEILALDAYCREREIDLVPNQNTLGHLHRWLNIPRYQPLAEVIAGSQFPWGHVTGPFSLSPANPESLKLVRSLLDELLPHFTSPLAHIGLDEAYDVGQGQSRELCEREGRGRVLLGFLRDVAAIVREHGRTPLFWADMLTRHDADVIQDLPDNFVACEWGYEADYDFDATLKPLAAKGLPFYVCPGTGSWLSFTGRAHTAQGNLKVASDAAQRYGALGYLITDWGDRGHFQPPAVSYPGFSYGAALAWNPATQLDEARERGLGLHILGDRTGEAGRVLWQYGRLHYDLVGEDGHNSARLARPLVFQAGEAGLDPAVLAALDRGAIAADLDSLPERAGEAAHRLASAMARCPMEAEDAPLIREEMRHAARAVVLGARVDQISRGAREGRPASPAVLRHVAADLAEWQNEFHDLWLRRFRPGGLSESLAFMDGAVQKLTPNP